VAINRHVYAIIIAYSVFRRKQGNNEMNFPRGLKDRLLPILVNRAAIFFFVMAVLTLFLYAIGTKQGFEDAIQLGLLRLYSVLGIFLVTTTICGLVLNIMRFASQKKAVYIFRALLYLSMALFGAATVLLVMFIFTLSAGN